MMITQPVRTAFLLALLTAACTAGAGSQGPLTFDVSVDAPTQASDNLQVSAFFPASLRVRPGDTVTFENLSMQAPHSVTFGLAADGSNMPPLVLDGPDWNPALFGPCFTMTPLSASLTACPQPPPAQTPPYAGSGFWNSGLLVPAIAPEGAKSVTLTVASGTEVGAYAFACVLHPPMRGALEVVASDAERTPPAQVQEASERARDTAVASAEAIAEPRVGPRQVAAGWGDGTTAVNRFAPATITVKRGRTVTWLDESPYEPHTITFDPPFGAEDPRAVVPAGAPGGTYTEGFANSGLIGVKPFPSRTYELRFAEPGTYAYVCALHPGMEGTVRVR